MLSFLICCFFFSMIGSKYLVLASDLKEKSIELANNASDMELDIYELEENIEKSDKSLTDTIVRIADIDTAVKMPMTGSINVYDESRAWLFDETFFYEFKSSVSYKNGSKTYTVSNVEYYVIPSFIEDSYRDDFYNKFFGGAGRCTMMSVSGGYILVDMRSGSNVNTSNGNYVAQVIRSSVDMSKYNDYLFEIPEPTPEPTVDPDPDDPVSDPTPEPGINPEIEIDLTRFDNHMDMIIFAFGVIIGILSGQFVMRFIK